ncbi:glycosyltransferase family 9 protein [Gordonia sp. DT30]|uniref:glycosyltransferase family 9 protein n=1 Tax=Gordonia sp. DT30 TaxID=3416546 RepID=UPI003CF42571
MTVNILVLRALGLGDLLTAVPALRGLRRGYPDAHITLATPDHLRPLVEQIGSVDRLLPVNGLDARIPRCDRVDIAVNLHGAGPQSTRLLADTRPRELITHAHPDLPGVAGPEWQADLHETRKWTRLLEWADMPADPTDLHLNRPHTSGRHDGVIVVHVGAAAAARRWPESGFAEVVANLACSAEVVLTGNEAERPSALAVANAAGLPDEQVLAGRQDLTELVGLIASARLVICGDTGVAHLATAYQTSSVVLFGPTPPSLWGPPSSPRHRVLWSGTTGDPHGDTTFPGLAAIRPEQVLAAVDDLNREVLHA